MTPGTPQPHRKSLPGAPTLKDFSASLKDDSQLLRKSLEHTWSNLWAPAGRRVVLAAGLVLAVGLGVFVTVPALYSRLDGYLANLPPVVVVQRSRHEALQVIAARAVLYPLRKGGHAFVVRGDVRNDSNQPQAPVDAQLQLRDAQGFVVAEARAPLGYAPRLVEIYELTDDHGWQALVQQTRAIGHAPLAPQAVVGFTLVVVNPPQPLSRAVPEIGLQ